MKVTLAVACVALLLVLVAQKAHASRPPFRSYSIRFYGEKSSVYQSYWDITGRLPRIRYATLPPDVILPEAAIGGEPPTVRTPLASPPPFSAFPSREWFGSWWSHIRRTLAGDETLYEFGEAEGIREILGNTVWLDVSYDSLNERHVGTLVLWTRPSYDDCSIDDPWALHPAGGVYQRADAPVRIASEPGQAPWVVHASCADFAHWKECMEITCGDLEIL